MIARGRGRYKVFSSGLRGGGVQRGRVEGLAGVCGVYEKIRGAVRGGVVGKDGVYTQVGG